VAETGRFQAVTGGTFANGVLTGTSPQNFLTLRHGGNANIGFADGHASSVPWRYGTNSIYVCAVQ
jgi:prepilin-type processing-associated H-X9-DG protein